MLCSAWSSWWIAPSGIQGRARDLLGRPESAGCVGHVSSHRQVNEWTSFFVVTLAWGLWSCNEVLLPFVGSGDYYLKPFVTSEPEVTVTERTDEDECLILASDGLWDVVSNETACGVVKMCLKSQKPPTPPGSPGGYVTADGSDRACSDASILLTKLALARHSADNVSVVVIDLRKDQGETSLPSSSSCV